LQENDKPHSFAKTENQIEADVLWVYALMPNRKLFQTFSCGGQLALDSAK
jgi:hypothetical protein